MPPRLNLFSAGRSLAIRSRPSIASRQPRILPSASRRYFADEKAPKPPATGPNEDVLGHVSEEAAHMSRITGETPPDIEQGTPVQEILKRDEESIEKAPQVIKDQIKKDEVEKAYPDGKNADSVSFENLLALGQLQNISEGGHASDPLPENIGHKFEIPELPLGPGGNLHERYDPVVDQVTNLIMKHGKLSAAQRHMSFVLNILRTAPPPNFNPARPLLPGAPPATFLPLDPIGYLTLAIDSIAPLLRLRSQKGAAGGGAALQIPVPLGLRQRRRTAIMWILDAAAKKKSRGSGRQQFAQRVADEIISVVEGRSSIWERRQMVHKTGTSARANLSYGQKKKRRL